MKLVNTVDKLIDACEAVRTIRMPRTVLMVKQLRKELNLTDVVKNLRKKGELVKLYTSFREATRHKSYMYVHVHVTIKIMQLQK